jgi:hypothetical protein
MKDEEGGGLKIEPVPNIMYWDKKTFLVIAGSIGLC